MKNGILAGVIVAALLLSSCSKETATVTVDKAARKVGETAEGVTEASKNLASRVRDEFDSNSPIGKSPTKEEIERERFNSEWRKLQSFRAATEQKKMAEARARQAAQAKAPPIANPVAIQTVDKLTEKLDKATIANANAAPIQAPIKGDVAGPSVLRAQVLLDRAGFSVGAIDGRWGKNSEIAVYWFQRENGIDPTGEVDEATFRALMAKAGSADALTRYQLSAQDLAGPFVGIPEDVYDKEKLDCLCYENVAEMLGERFHVKTELLEMLNPSVTFANPQPGTELVVPAIRPQVPEGAAQDVAKIVVSVKGSYLHGIDAAGNVLFHAPTTLGNKYDPSPSENTSVVGIVQNPHFHYQPKLFHEVPDSDPEANLQPGPNSPVGRVWMALKKPHFGIHGTADPESIGYASSHGCVRLTNWDVVDLSRRTRKGITVEFVDTRKSG